MPYEILCNFWLICCNIIGRLFCKRKGDHDLAGPYLYSSPLLGSSSSSLFSLVFALQYNNSYLQLYR